MKIYGSQAEPLRHYLFRLVDIPTPKSISMIVTECLAVGASLLLPPLRQRLHLLQSLLPYGSTLTKGKVNICGQFAGVDIAGSSLYKFEKDEVHYWPTMLLLIYVSTHGSP